MAGKLTRALSVAWIVRSRTGNGPGANGSHLPALANVTESQRLDRACLNGQALVRFGVDVTWKFVQVGRPGKESHCESPIQRLSELRVAMEVVKRSPPLLQGIRSGATTQTLSDPWLQGAAPHPKPLGGLSVEFVPGEFIHDDAATRAQKAADPVEDNRQAVDMV